MIVTPGELRDRPHGRRWVTLTPELQTACHTRITDSYKFPEDVKTAHHIERIAV